jgi:hypothetical protein
MFDQGVDAALTTMTNFVNARLRRYKIDRYLSVPLLGAAAWIRDQFLGLPDDVNAFYEEGRRVFQASMDALIIRVANRVEQRLKEAKDEVARGQAAIKAEVASMPASLRSFAQQAAANYQSQFADLERGIEDKKNQLAQGLAQKYKEAADKANEALKKIQDENKGLVQGFMEKLGEVIRMLAEFKAKLMGLLRKGAETIKLILADPLGFLGNLIAAIKGGINAFVGNIWTHLRRGFMQWLFGALASAGIEIPSDLSLPSILKLVLSVLGITYDRMRAKAVRLIGERNVRIIEKLVEYLRALITGGPAALWEKVKEDLSSLKQMVIDAIQNWLIETVVKQAVAKIVSMFNPAGAIIQAILAIYNIVMFVIEKAAQIMAFVEAVINSVHAIATGAIGGAISWIEQALARTIQLVIGFLARLLGLGGISQKIKEFITRVQARVDAAIDKAIDKIVQLVKRLFGRGAAAVRRVFRIGQDVSFSSAGESHRVFIDQQSGEPMIASSPVAVKRFLASTEVKDAAKNDSTLAGLVSQALALEQNTKIDSLKVLQAQTEQQADPANAQVKNKQQQMAALLNQIIAKVKGTGSIVQVIGKAFSTLRGNVPEGYLIKTYAGVQEIERSRGSRFPPIHADAADILQPGWGVRRGDYALIKRYRDALKTITQNGGDEQPDKLLGNPESLVSDLHQRMESGSESLFRAAVGIRSQMERIMDAIKAGEVLTGVEVQFGPRPIDLTVIRSGENVAIEYKHWTGKLSQKTRRRRRRQLEEQLTEQLENAVKQNMWDKLIVEFKNFGSLDPTTQSAFREVFRTVKTRERNINRRKSTKRAITFIHP